MKKYTIILLLLTGGCSNLDYYEATWQTLHVIDVAQTVNSVGREPECFDESNAMTSSIIGSKPSDREIYMWGATMSAAHYLFSVILDEIDISEGFKTGIKLADIGYKASVVKSNHDAGARPYGNNQNDCSKGLRMTIYEW